MRMSSRRLVAPARIRRKARGREARHPRRRSLLSQGLRSQGSSSHNGWRRQLCPTCPLRALCWHPTLGSGKGLVLVVVGHRGGASWDRDSGMETPRRRVEGTAARSPPKGARSPRQGAAKEGTGVPRPPLCAPPGALRDLRGSSYSTHPQFAKCFQCALCLEPPSHGRENGARCSDASPTSWVAILNNPPDVMCVELVVSLNPKPSRCHVSDKMRPAQPPCALPRACAGVNKCKPRLRGIQSIAERTILRR
jgi:hypothetical protein